MEDSSFLKLKKDFPVLFSRITYTGCGDGWYNLIHSLSSMLVLAQPDIVATQVKEKFGQLRFYVDRHDKTASTLIQCAESISDKICETCGEPGTLKNNGGWLKTVCDKHTKNRS